MCVKYDTYVINNGASVVINTQETPPGPAFPTNSFNGVGIVAGNIDKVKLVKYNSDIIKLGLDTNGDDIVDLYVYLAPSTLVLKSDLMWDHAVDLETDDLLYTGGSPVKVITKALDTPADVWDMREDSGYKNYQLASQGGSIVVHQSFQP